MGSNKEYLLGVNQYELDRLEFQHNVWKELTESFLDRLNIGAGMKVLDAGSGPGFVTMDLRKRVGDSGEVTALEPSKMYLDHFRNYSGEKGWNNTEFILGNAETAELPKGHFDLIFARWVIGFVPDPELFVKKLTLALKPGGILALQDYAFHGLNLYPRGGSYEKLSPAVEEYWKSTGGDLRIAARIPGIFKAEGLGLIDYKPNTLAGSPGSGVFEWHHLFLTQHVPLMAEKNIISIETGKEIIEDWNAHRANPDSLFFSPLVVDMAGKKL